MVGTWLMVRCKADYSYFLNFEKKFVIRTHPEELRVVKRAPKTRISTNFYPQ